VTSTIDFTVTDKMTLCLGLRKTSDARAAVLVEMGTNYGGSGKFGFFAPGQAAPDIAAGLSGSSANPAAKVIGISSPATFIASAKFDYALNSINSGRLRANSGDFSVLNVAPGEQAAFTNNPIYIGARAGNSLQFPGNLYTLTILGAETSAEELAQLEQYVADKTGVTL